MTKAEIIARIDEKVGFSKNHATDVVEATFEIIKSCLEKGGNVKISGFGRFVVRDKSPRRARNPKTGGEDYHQGSPGTYLQGKQDSKGNY